MSQSQVAHAHTVTQRLSRLSLRSPVVDRHGESHDKHIHFECSSSLTVTEVIYFCICLSMVDESQPAEVLFSATVLSNGPNRIERASSYTIRTYIPMTLMAPISLLGPAPLHGLSFHVTLGDVTEMGKAIFQKMLCRCRSSEKSMA